jgi:hypothetical protein
MTGLAASVGDNCDEIAPGCVVVDEFFILVDLAARFGHTRRIGQGKVKLRGDWFCPGDFNLSRAAFPVIAEGVFSLRHGRILSRAPAEVESNPENVLISSRQQCD